MLYSLCREIFPPDDCPSLSSDVVPPCDYCAFDPCVASWSREPAILAQAFEWTVPHVVVRGRRTPSGSATSVAAPLRRVCCTNVSLGLVWLGSERVDAPLGPVLSGVA